MLRVIQSMDVKYVNFPSSSPPHTIPMTSYLSFQIQDPESPFAANCVLPSDSTAQAHGAFGSGVPSGFDSALMRQVFSITDQLNQCTIVFPEVHPVVAPIFVTFRK
jgi:hypothetical protein